MSPSNSTSPSKNDIAGMNDAHSAFLFSSKRLIETTQKKLEVMNGLSDELRYLASQIKEDKPNTKISTFDSSNSTEDDTKLSKKQNIKVVVPKCMESFSEIDKVQSANKVSRRKVSKKNSRSKKSEESLADLAKRYCKDKHKRTSKLDPIKYLEAVESNKIEREELEEKYRSESISKERFIPSGNSCLQSDEVSSANTSPRENLLPVITITRKSAARSQGKDSETNINSNSIQTSNETKCANCLERATREKQCKDTLRPADLNFAFEAGDLESGSGFKSCQNNHKHKQTSSSDINHVIFYEVNRDISLTGIPRTDQNNSYSYVSRCHRDVKTGRVHASSSRMPKSDIHPSSYRSLELLPEKITCPQIVCYDPNGTLSQFHNDSVKHRQVLRPNKITLQSSHQDDVTCLPLENASMGFRFRIGKKSSCSVSFDSRFHGKIQHVRNHGERIQKSKTLYEQF